MTIAQRIMEVMKERSITQGALAKGTGIRQSTISDWITKGTSPSADKIIALCSFLNVSADWLLTGEEKLPPNSIAGDVNGSAFVQGMNTGSVTIHNGRAHPISAEAAELLKLYEGLPLKKKSEAIADGNRLIRK